MEKKKIELKEIGMVLIILAVFDLFMIVAKNIIFLVSGQWNEAMATLDPTFQTVVQGVIIAIVVLNFLVLAAQIYLGKKAFDIAGNRIPANFGGPIALAKVLGVFSLFLAVMGAFALITNFNIDDLFALLVTLSDALLLFSYAKYSKAICSGN